VQKDAKKKDFKYISLQISDENLEKAIRSSA
jgi:hypothetical protein